MNIVYALTRNYYNKILPSLRSLAEHEPKAKVYILAEDDELPFDTPQKVNVINISDQHQFDNGVNIQNRFGGYINLLKVYYPNILARLNKVIHLDVDTIICDSLKDFWDIDVTGKWIAAVPEYKAVHSQLKLYGDIYYNAGVMLINLAQMRKDNICDTMAKFLNEVPQPFADQDAWNKYGIEQDKVAVVPVRFNESISTGFTGHPAIMHFCAYSDWWENPYVPGVQYLNRWKSPR